MKYLLEQPTIHKYSLCNDQERICYLKKIKLSDDKGKTLIKKMKILFYIY
jgi:hypothetical protein